MAAPSKLDSNNRMLRHQHMFECEDLYIGTTYRRINHTNKMLTFQENSCTISSYPPNHLLAHKSIVTQGIPITKENYLAAMERGSLPLPRLAGYNEDGTPEGQLPTSSFSSFGGASMSGGNYPSSGLDRSPTWASGATSNNGPLAMGGAGIMPASSSAEMPPWDHTSKPVVVQGR